MTEDEVKRMKGEGGFLSDRVVLVQFTKRPEVVARTTNMLAKYRHNEKARQYLHYESADLLRGW